MNVGLQPAQTDAAWPRVLRYCTLCHQETPHEIHLAAGVGVIVTVCLPCLARTLNYELDRD
jgi:hypothetical protein